MRPGGRRTERRLPGLFRRRERREQVPDIIDTRFEGYDGRECGEHRTTGPRAWCFNCQEWCYPDIPCRGCELPLFRARAERAEAAVQALERAIRKHDAVDVTAEIERSEA